MVHSLGSLATESASAVNPALVQLQMLSALSEAWPLRWPARPLSLSLAPPPPLASPGDGGEWRPAVPADAALDEVEQLWREREAVAGALRSGTMPMP